MDSSPQYSPTWAQESSTMDYSSSQSASSDPNFAAGVDEHLLVQSESSEVSSTESENEQSQSSSSEQQMNYDHVSSDGMDQGQGRYSPFQSE